jgi:hypothetical protein
MVLMTTFLIHHMPMSPNNDIAFRLNAVFITISDHAF